MQRITELKPATINRRLVTLKRFFEWAITEEFIRRDPSKPVKLVPEEKVSPRQMTDKEEAAREDITIYPTIYRFVSDQSSSFYAKVIHTNARDAVHVIDDLLHHETDLVIEEHYTDTAGYTGQVFGLTHLLGFRFAPRLRDLADSKLYSIGKASEYPKLEKLLRGQINTKVIREN